ncbi:MAG: hypothetical protein WKF97_23720 [Chitinophagaceae bacterium]
MKQDWKFIMKQLKLQHLKATAPGFFEASGGYGMGIKKYDDRTANGLTRCIIDFLTFKGHYANRILTQGQARFHDIKRFNIFSENRETVSNTVTWTKGTTRRGSPDLTAIICGVSVNIEVKIGKDKMSPEQERERSAIQKAGGLNFIAHDMPSFIDFYNSIICQNEKQA